MKREHEQDEGGESNPKKAKPKPQSGSNKTARRKSYYAAQFGRTEANKRRSMLRHMRHHPDDQQAPRLFTELFGRG